MTAEIDKDMAEELALYLDNTSELYAQKKAIIANIERKLKRGVYDHNKAPKLWGYWVDAGAKRYVKEFGGDVRTEFPKKLREYVALHIANRELQLIQRGEYREHVPISSGRPGQKFSHGDVQIETTLHDIYPAKLRGLGCGCDQGQGLGGRRADFEKRLHDDEAMHTSLSFGQMPPLKEFLEVYAIRVGQNRLSSGRYMMELTGEDAEAMAAIAGPGEAVRRPFGSHFTTKQHYAFDGRDLYNVLAQLGQSGDDAAMSLGSGIMSTLGYEWI